MPASRSRRASSYDFASDVWANRLLLVDSTLSPIATPRALTLEEPTPFALDEDWWHAEAPAEAIAAVAEAVLADSTHVSPVPTPEPITREQRAADTALRRAICSGALSPLRRVIDKHAEHASPSVLADARRFRERLRYRAKRAAKQHRRTSKEQFVGSADGGDAREQFLPPESPSMDPSEPTSSIADNTSPSSTSPPDSAQASMRASPTLTPPSSNKKKVEAAAADPASTTGLTTEAAPASERVSSSGGAGSSRTLPPEAYCPITRLVMVDPVVTEDGEAYERSAISKWLSQHGTSPRTGEALSSHTLTPVPAIRALTRAIMQLQHEASAEAQAAVDSAIVASIREPSPCAHRRSHRPSRRAARVSRESSRDLLCSARRIRAAATYALWRGDRLESSAGHTDDDISVTGPSPVKDADSYPSLKMRYKVMALSAGVDAISLRQGTSGGRPAARFSVVEDRKRHEEYAAWGASLYSDATSLLFRDGSGGFGSRSHSAESIAGVLGLEDSDGFEGRAERPAPGVSTSYRSCPYP